MSASSTSEWVMPGDKVGAQDQHALGSGVYSYESGIYASVLGRVYLHRLEESDDAKKTVVSVIANNNLSESILNVGDRVTCRVIKLSLQQAFTEVIAIGDNILKYYPKGVIRKENARATDIDSVIINDMFRPGDIVKATVFSEGDAKYFFLSTADADLGVQYARSKSSGELMQAIDQQSMEDPITKEIEYRKVAIIQNL